MDDGDPSHSGRILPELSNLELVVRLRKCRCTGVLWLRTVDRVVSYGTGTLRRQLLDGSVNVKLAELGRPMHLSVAERDYLRTHLAERDDLVEDAVFGGLLLLRERAVLGVEWDPARGADLMTYFVNGCLLNLLNPVRDWRHHRRAVVSTVAYDGVDLDALDVLGSPHGDPAWDVHDRAALEDLLAALPPTITEVARSVACDGLSWADACRRHRVSPRAVEGHLRRYRRRHCRLEEDR